MATPASRHHAAAAHPQPARNPWLVLLVLCTAVFMLLLDTTIVNVAQVKIREGLDADLSEIQWVLDSYILTYAVFLLSFGRLGDVFGRRRMFVAGMVIFTVASALCGASGWLGDQLGISGATALIAARVLQGFGGALMMPQSLAIISTTFPPEKRGAAMGIWGSIVAIGAVVGPVVGGLIVTHYAWEWVFLINLPVGVVAVLATLAIVPESTDPQATRRIDWGGVLLSGSGIFAVVYALIEGNGHGWSSPLIIGLFVAGVALLAAFVWWERRVADPMMKIELFRLRNFWVGNVISLVVAFGMFGIFFPITIFLQSVLGFTPIRAGLSMIPMSLMILVVAPLAGRFSDRIGARWIIVTGMSLMTVGILFIIRQTNLDTTWATLAPALAMCGMGMGMTFAPMTAAAMREVPPRIAGSASGILNTTRNIGQVLGIAVMGTLLQNRLNANAEEGLASLPLEPAVRDRIAALLAASRFEDILGAIPPGNADLVPQVLFAIRQAFVDSLHTTFFVASLACLVGVSAALLLRNPARAGAATAGRAETATREREPALVGD